MYLLDVLDESHTAQLLLNYLLLKKHETQKNKKIIFATTIFFGSKNVPGVLKRQKKMEGGCLGAHHTPPPPPGGRAGLENATLLPLTMTGQNSGTIRLEGQKLLSGNLGGGKIKTRKNNSDKTIRHSRWGMPNNV